MKESQVPCLGEQRNNKGNVIVKINNNNNNNKITVGSKRLSYSTPILKLEIKTGVPLRQGL